MNESPTNHRWVALALVALCGIAVVLGIVQLAKNEAVVKSVATDEHARGPMLGGSGDRLAYITLDGMIAEGVESNGLFSQESGAMRARKLLYFASKDKSVKGVLLRINSPGGTVGMSQELYNAVMTVRKTKPVVVSMGDLAASGGYYTAAAADKIVANPGTLTASIGVILQSVNAQKLMTEKLGVQAVTVKSGKFKDILSPYRAPTEADLALLQHIIDTSYQQFLHAVLDGRTKDMKDAKAKQHRIENITAIADGRVVIGEDALKVGLVDALGGLEEAKALLQDIAGKRFDISNPRKLTLQQYETPFSFWDYIGVESRLNMNATKAGLSGPDARTLLPNSLRYANQPLWLMESYTP